MITPDDELSESAIQLIARYHEFIEIQPHEGFEIERTSPDQYVLSVETARAEINFWDDILEFSVDNTKTGEGVFYLHFQLREDDWDHCKALYGELVAALLDQKNRRTVNILLSCSAGMTTYFFADKLNNLAAELSMDYSFSAVSVSRIYEEGFKYDAVLIAPQVAYMYDKICAVLEGKTVIQIPTRMFASYDAASCLEMVRDAVEGSEEEEADEEPQPSQVFGSVEEIEANILTVVLKHAADHTEIGWRVYENDEIRREGSVIKRGPLSASDADEELTGSSNLSMHDFTDLIDTVMATVRDEWEVEAIGVAVVGSVNHGRVRLPDTALDGVNVEDVLHDRYHMPVVVANNVNAAALGWYGQQDKYKDIVFHSQSRGILLGGQGVVIDGRLHEGRRSLAGELQNFYPNLRYDLLDDGDYLTRRLWDPDQVVELLAKVFSIDVGILAPEVICVRSKLTPDVDAIRRELSKYVPLEDQPDIVFIPHFTEYVFLGMRTLTFERLTLGYA